MTNSFIMKEPTFCLQKDSLDAAAARFSSSFKTLGSGVTTVVRSFTVLPIIMILEPFVTLCSRKLTSSFILPVLLGNWKPCYNHY